MDDRRLAVLFPGIGYNFDRPLLHFEREQALQYGYEIQLVPYTGFPKNIRGDAAKMQQAYDMAWEQTGKLLQNVRWADCERIVFVSKSIGTIVAVQYAHSYGIAADQILFTPFPETFSVPIAGRAIAFHAEMDPWMDNKAVIEAARKAGVPMYCYPEGNHSLETGDARKDIGILQDVFTRTAAFFAADPAN